MKIPHWLVVGFCTAPWVAALVGFSVLVLLRFPPSGTFVGKTNFDGKSPWIFPFLPSERASKPGKQPDGWVGQRITGDPAYATAHVPGPYESAEVSIEYRVERQPLIEFGLVQGTTSDLSLTSMYAAELDSPQWQRVTSGPVSGFVRNAVPASRLRDPNPSGVAVWDATATTPLLSDPLSSATTTHVALRGAHDFSFVPAGGKVVVTFTYQLANRKAGTDTIAFRAFHGEEEIPDASYVTSASNEVQMGNLQTHTVTISNAEPGVYRVSFLAPDDVFIRSIETTSRHWVVGPRVYVADAVGFLKETAPANVWTNSRHLVAETFHVEGIQTVAFGDRRTTVPRTHTVTRMDRTDTTNGPVLLSAPKGDIRFILDGYASFRPDAFFEPKPRRFTDATDVDTEHLQAVLTPYRIPEKLNDGWMRSTFHFPLHPDTDTLRFVLSAPGIMTRLGAVDIRSVTITYHRPATQLVDWLITLRQELANAWHRL